MPETLSAAVAGTTATATATATAAAAAKTLAKTPFLTPWKPLKFPTFSSQTPTISLPPKPIKIPPSPPPSPPPPPPRRREDTHLEKLLFLDSIGLDSLSLLTHHSTAVSAADLRHLRPLTAFLSSFNFSSTDLRRIFSMCPEILARTLNDVVSVFTFLLREAHVSAADLRRVIRRRPRLLACHVSTRLRPTLYFLQSIGIHEVNKHTDLLSCSVEEKFMPKIEFFLKVGFSYRDSVSMFRRFPPLFCYSISNNFEPKLNYFVVEMGRDLKELKEFPQYFSFSLERRIKPRHKVCVEKGVCFALAIMLKMKEKEFCERLNVCCNTSLPLSSSPLWCSNDSDLDIV